MKVDLYGVVFDYENIVEQLNNAEEDVELVINSPGGDVFAGFQIVNAIKKCKGKVTANVEVMGASIAGVIALACDEIQMGKNDLLMLHNCWTYAEGNKEELAQSIALMEKIDAIIQDEISAKCKQPKAIVDAMNAGEELWFNGDEAMEAFNNITIVERRKCKAAAAAILPGLVAKAKLYDAMKAEIKTEVKDAIEEVVEEVIEEYKRSPELEALLNYNE